MTQRNINLFKQAWTGIQSITAKITGTNTDAVYVETSDANAAAADMRSGKSGYVNGVKVDGSAPSKSSDDVTGAFNPQIGYVVSVPAGIYDRNVSHREPNAALTVTAEKGTASNHQISVTPKLNLSTAGYVGASKNGTAVTVSASELVSGSETKTANGTYDVTNLAQLVVNVSGGGGSGLTLLATKSLGTISTSSTTATDTGQTVSVPNAGSYDLLLVVAGCNKTNSRHFATASIIELYSTSNVENGRSSTNVANVKLNFKVDGSGNTGSRVGTSGYGLYPNSCSLSSGTASMPIYQRYSSTYTGTINGTYTVKVYGVNLYGML